MKKNKQKEEIWGPIVAGDLTWYEVHVGLGDGGASCHRQVGKSRVKGQVTCNKDQFSHQLMAAS